MQDIVHFLVDFSAFTTGFLRSDLLPQVFQQGVIFLIHSFRALVKVSTIVGLLLHWAGGDDLVQRGAQSPVLFLLTGVLLSCVVSRVHLRQDVKVVIESRHVDVRLNGLVISVVSQVNVKLVDVPEV